MMRKKGLPLLFCILLLSCAPLEKDMQREVRPVIPGFAVEAEEAIPVSSSRIEIFYDIPRNSVHPGFVVVPQSALREYLPSKLQAVGLRDKLEVSVNVARVTHRPIAAKRDYQRLLGVGKSDEYTIEIGLSLTPVTDHSIVKPGRRINASRTITISEHTKLVERERQQIAAMEKLLDDLGRALEKNLRQIELYMPSLTLPTEEMQVIENKEIQREDLY